MEKASIYEPAILFPVDTQPTAERYLPTRRKDSIGAGTGRLARHPRIPEEDVRDGMSVAVELAQLDLGDSLSRYESWKAPTVIVADGPYGLARFPGDPPTPDGLAQWYAPHVAAWATYSSPETTLWLWNTEVGWANVHPVLAVHGWVYRALHIWDKGIGHIAGNVNSKTIRGFPVVTEVCAQYVREVCLETELGERLPLPQWLRYEWLRSGLPLTRTNQACGVKNAATRKYFTQDHVWYFPPPEMMERLAAYANQNGRSTSRPYFSLDGKTPVTGEQWGHLRAKWNHCHGVTNVWSEPAVRGSERLKDAQAKCLHANQKPIKLLERIIQASSDEGDVVWEPFGGLCSVAVSALRTGRRCYSAEINPEFYRLAKRRLELEGSRLISLMRESAS